MSVRQLSVLITSAILLISCVQFATAGKSDRGGLQVRVSPREAYIYADGEPVVEARGHYATLTPGDHEIELYNYGYKPELRNVTIVAHKMSVLDVTMQPIPGKVTGPWGCITLEGASRAAVLLNGRDPAVFFVGHGDEFNNERIWKQELIVPPGKHQLTVEHLDDNPWTTTVDVEANKRVVVDAFKGVRKTVDWPSGQQLKELPRFQAGIASARVVVEKVSGQLAVSGGEVNCGEAAHLTWSSTGAGTIQLNGRLVRATGDETVQPKQSTDYKFVAAGPGGVYTSDAKVAVNPAISASLTVSPAEVRTDGSNPKGLATVSWSAPNADSVTIDPIGSVSPTGTRQIDVTPNQSSGGAIDQTVTYTLHASNACGGAETRTATLHLTGTNGVLQGAANEPAAPTPPAAAAPVEEAANRPPAAPKQLPHTASELPLMGLVGMFSLLAAASLRVILKRSV